MLFPFYRRKGGTESLGNKCSQDPPKTRPLQVNLLGSGYARRWGAWSPEPPLTSYRPQPPTLPTALQATTSEDKMTLPLWRADSERCQHSFPPLPVLVKKEAITRRLHSDTFGPGQIIPPARHAQESLGHSPPACWERAEDSRAGRMLCFSFAHLWLLISNARGGVGGFGGSL